MTLSHRSWYSLAAIVVPLALPLAGCMSARSQAFRMSFLPSTPAATSTDFDEPPKIASNLYASETPDLVQKALAAPPVKSGADAWIFRAETHFDLGRKLYQQGDKDAARREFDTAMSILLSVPENIGDRQKLDRRLDQMADTIYRYDLEGFGAAASSQMVYDKPPIDDFLQLTFPTDPNLRPKVKEEVEATVSQLPLEYNDAVLSYIHYFSTDRGHKVLVSGLRRAGRYRPMIQRIFDEEGLPQELIYLAQAESGFLPRAKSCKQAVGMWQFVKFRGKEYGLEQTASTDDRMDPERATRAAARHLRDLYATFGDWYLAMAAYNCGPGCVEHAVARTGFADFWELSRLNVLPKQTSNYVPLILAITIMAKNPKDYALESLDSDEPLIYDSVALEAPTHLSLVADAIERPVSEIQDLNPALLKPIAPAGYQLHVPQGSASAVRAALESIPAVHRASWRVHKTQPGETLETIAHHYAMSASSLAAVNHQMMQPEPGDLVIIPTAYTQRATARTAKSAVRSGKPVARHRPSRKLAASRRTVAANYRTAALRTAHHRAAN